MQKYRRTVCSNENEQWRRKPHPRRHARMLNDRWLLLISFFANLLTDGLALMVHFHQRFFVIYFLDHLKSAAVHKSGVRHAERYRRYLSRFEDSTACVLHSSIYILTRILLKIVRWLEEQCAIVCTQLFELRFNLMFNSLTLEARATSFRPI